ncbi:MAG: FAD-dependent oxidoreductase, partial [Xanthomonadales bacterium]|nr:FAD-dependent oxidoreductase [Xanthomonadales bacterium]
MNKQADLLVMGGGSGGLAAAIRAARHSAKVVLFEPHELGGTCVNRGCVPKKAMWYAAELAQAQVMAQAVGFGVVPGKLDWSAFVAHREAYIARSRDSYARRLHELGIEWVPQVAQFLDAHTLRAGDDEWRAPHVLVATGARPRELGIIGAEHTINSDDFFKL